MYESKGIKFLYLYYYYIAHKMMKDEVLYIYLAEREGDVLKSVYMYVFFTRF